MDGFDGTHYVLHRKDRYAVSTGIGLLSAHRLRDDSPTRRMVATCCNTPMFLAFDNAQHWISAYRSRISDRPPTLESRIATRFSRNAGSLPRDVPSYKAFPVRMVMKLLLCRAQMAIGR